MSLEEIHRKICEGCDVRVVDANSESDITSKVLMQILLEYEPVKLDFFSTDLLTRVIRVNDSILKEFFERYFGKAFKAFCMSQRNLEDLMREAHMLPSSNSNPFSATLGAMNPLATVFRPKAQEQVSTDDLVKELARLRQEIEGLKSSSDSA